MRTFILSFAFMVMGTFFSSAQTTQKEAANKTASKIEAYYFHFNARCVTCMAVEAEAKSDIESLYPGKATFKAVNLDDASSKTIADRLKVTGQTLLFVKGNKQINLTSEGFLYAKTNPAKLKSIIKQKVDAL